MKSTNAVDEALARAEREGRVKDASRTCDVTVVDAIAADKPAKLRKPRKDELVDPLYVRKDFWEFVWVIPLWVKPGDNSRNNKARIGRAGHERTACTRVFARGHEGWCRLVDLLRDNHKLKITLTRLAPRRLDRINVEAAMKYVADTVAAWLGVDDNDPRLQWQPCEQETSPKCGVRVEISKA